MWSNWCAKSRDNARYVYEDAGRDVADIFDAFMKWGTETAQPTDWLDPIATAKQDLSKQALLLGGIQSLEGAYKRVSEAAKDCGIGEHFALSYKLLSKFAHPTAMQILAGPDNQQEALLRDFFSARAVSPSLMHSTPLNVSCCRRSVKYRKPIANRISPARRLSGVLFSGFIPSRDGSDFGLLIR